LTGPDGQRTNGTPVVSADITHLKLRSIQTMGTLTQVLIIDDDTSLLDVLSLAVEDAGYRALTATDGSRGLAIIRSEKPDVVICDINMPGVDGFTLCRKLRAENNLVPLIMLTSRDSEIDETLGLELGADDYISKPFSTRVLLARVAALLRREALRGGAEREKPLTQGDLEVFPERLEVRYKGEPLKVTVTEFRLLEVLLRRPGVVFSRERLLEIIRGDAAVVVDRIIDTYIRRLRRLFETVDPAFDRIETVVGVGYRWKTRGS
jgi:DNA-binding response OmpR family regulator